jgi:hypothetical protein
MSIFKEEEDSFGRVTLVRLTESQIVTLITQFSEILIPAPPCVLVKSQIYVVHVTIAPINTQLN